jgi:TonB family protein
MEPEGTAMDMHERSAYWALPIVFGAILLATQPATAAAPEQVKLFLNKNKIYLRIPDGPQYPASIDSPVYESYASERAARCEQPPEVQARTEIRQFYRPEKGGETGRVRLELLVSPAGRVVAVQLRESPGSLAVYSVIHAVKDWTFDPGLTEDGEPTYCRFEFTVDFVPP